MSQEKWALMIAMLAGVGAQNVKMGAPTLEQWTVGSSAEPTLFVTAPSKAEEQVINEVTKVDDMVDYLVSRLYDRVLTPSGLESTTQGKSTVAMQTTPGQLTAPS